MAPETVEALVPRDLTIVDPAELTEPAGIAEAADGTGAMPVQVVAQRRRLGVAGEWPLALVITAAGAGLLVIAMHHFRWGNLMIGGSLLLAAALRLVLPTRRAGLLVVRGRATDVVTMAALGGSLLLLAAVTRT